MERLVANIATGSIRRETLNGREYIVAPISLIVPGVLVGNKGPLLYPPDEVSKNPSAWDGHPIVVNHPIINGRPVSAHDERVKPNWIGFLKNTVYNGKLRAEGWFDVERTRAADMRVLNALNSGMPLESSTGLITKNTPVNNGEHNGVRYTAIARNYRPDHLAVLPDHVGACSIKDGCGVLVNQEGEPVEEVENEASHSQIHGMLMEQLAKRFSQSDPHAYIEDVYDDYFIYCQGDNKYRLGYTKVGDDEVKLDKTPVEVRRVVEYEPVTNQNPHAEGTMSKLADDAKKKIVDNLITNCGCAGASKYTEADRETLNGLPDAILTNMDADRKALAEREQVANAAKEGFTNGNPKPPKEDDVKTLNQMSDEELEAEMKRRKGAKKPTTNSKEGQQVVINRQPVSDDEWMEQAPESVRNRLAYADELLQAEKRDLIQRLVANVAKEEVQDVANELMEKDLKELRSMARLVPEKPRRQPTFFGAAGGGGSPVHNRLTDDDQEDRLELPTINWKEWAKANHG